MYYFTTEIFKNGALLLQKGLFLVQFCTNIRDFLTALHPGRRLYLAHSAFLLLATPILL